MEKELLEEILLFSTLSLQLPPIPHQRKEISLFWVPLVRKGISYGGRGGGRSMGRDWAGRGRGKGYR
ncbi:hypothetical protein V6N13_032677 [Hibiscus sabdariffa]|uniref:Uncharacterized protein n=1 Tax=Hibiscus sabdariffa TaxID=183260 RepID=A0ABR2FCC3_9ROSI